MALGSLEQKQGKHCCNLSALDPEVGRAVAVEKGPLQAPKKPSSAVLRLFATPSKAFEQPDFGRYVGLGAQGASMESVDARNVSDLCSKALFEAGLVFTRATCDDES